MALSQRFRSDRSPAARISPGPRAISAKNRCNPPVRNRELPIVPKHICSRKHYSDSVVPTQTLACRTSVLHTQTPVARKTRRVRTGHKQRTSRGFKDAPYNMSVLGSCSSRSSKVQYRGRRCMYYRCTELH
jgi:hypothetical protein